MWEKLYFSCSFFVLVTDNISSSTPSPSTSSTPSTTPSSVLSCNNSQQDTPVSAVRGRSRIAVQRWAEEYEVPWGHTCENFMSACQSGKRPKKTDLLAAIRTIAADIRKTSDHPGKVNLQIIAHKMVAKFPSSFADCLPATGLLGNGTISLTHRLVAQFDNKARCEGNSLRRKLLSPSSAGSADGEEPVVPTKRKPVSTVAKNSYGCVNWQPDFPEGETETMQTNKKSALLEEFSKPSQDRNLETIHELMDATYPSQRFFINNDKPPMSGHVINDKEPPKSIHSEWPFLLNREFMMSHFSRLMGFKLSE